jgi:hypothetical protein
MSYNALSGSVLVRHPGNFQANYLSGNLSNSDGSDVINVPRISNATNDSVITNVSGDANNLTCESNLKFDGDTLSITGELTASTGVSASYFMGDGSRLVGVAAGGSNVFTEANSSKAYTTSSINVGSSATPSHTLNVVGTMSGSGTLEAAGATYIGGTLGVTGALTAKSTVSGAASTFTTLAGTSLALQSGGITATGPIAGATTYSGSSTLHTVGAATFGNTLNVTGAVSGAAGFTGATWTSDGAISGSSTLEVVGATTFGSTVGVTGSMTAASASFTTVHATGNSQFDGNVNLGNARSDVITIPGRLTASQGAYFNSRVGIGTTTPDEKLHIRGTSPTVLIRPDDSQKGQIRFHHVNSWDSVFLELGTAGGFNIMNKNEDEDITIQCNNGGDHTTHVKFDGNVPRSEFNPDNKSGFSFRVRSQSKDNMFYVNALNDTVGISCTDNPGDAHGGGDYPLSIRRKCTGGSITKVLRIIEADTDADQNLTTANGAALDFFVAENTGAALGARIAAQRESNADTNTASGLAFSTYGDAASGAERMRITTSGNVGIGTATPTHKLQVVGTISGSSTLEVVGNTVIGGNLSVSGTFSQTGTFSPTNISSSGTLQVVGATILGSTLNVSGAITAASTVSGGAATFTTIGGTSLALQSGGITAAGAIAGATTYSGSSTLQSVGAAIFGSTLAVTGAATFASTTSGSGQVTYGNNVLISGDTYIGGDLSVSGTFSPTNISSSGTLQMVGATILGNTLNVSGAITAASTVSGGAATFTTLAGTSLALQSGGITAAGAIAGATTVSGTAATFTTLAGTSLALQNGGITAAGAIAGATTVSGTAATFTTLAGTSLALQSGGITAAGAIAGVTTLSVASTATFNGAVALGDATGDLIGFTGSLGSDIIPDVNNEWDLGSASKKFNTLYVNNISSPIDIVWDVESVGNGDTIASGTDFALVTAGNRSNVTLPAASAGKHVRVKLSSSIGDVFVNAGSGDLIEGESFILMESTGSAITCVAYDGQSWFIV